MKIKIVQACYLAGKRLRAGEVLSVSDMQARQLVEMERATPVREEAKAQEYKPQAKPEKGGK